MAAGVAEAQAGEADILTDQGAMEAEQTMAKMVERRGDPPPPLLVGRELTPEKAQEVWKHSLPTLMTDGKFDVSKLKHEWAVMQKMVSYFWVVIWYLSDGRCADVGASPVDICREIEQVFAEKMP